MLLPTDLHKDVSIKCLRAGLHVLCEKPMALNSNKCASILNTVLEMGKEFMVAHCIRFWPPSEGESPHGTFQSNRYKYPTIPRASWHFCF
ncbi:MAG: Gfo/Idh/MocA family oxidoreductase [Opitutales bacterium]